MSRGPITTRFEERANKLLARLGADDDVKAFLPHLTRAFIDAVGELEAARGPVPVAQPIGEAAPPVSETAAEPISEEAEPVDDTQDNTEDDTTAAVEYARHVNAHDLPVCWAGGINATQHILDAIAEEIGAAPGRPRLVRITITPTLEILIDGNTVGHITHRYTNAFRPLTGDGPIATIGELAFSSAKDLWCLRLGDNS